MAGKLQELEQRINWNWIGLMAGALSVIVTFYNIKQYTSAIKRGEKGGIL